MQLEKRNRYEITKHTQVSENIYQPYVCVELLEDALQDLHTRIQRHEDEVKEPVRKIQELETRVYDLELTVGYLKNALGVE